jgi:exopolysaccharide biosynthesis polyprenyl glycosylphosphotransferase
MQSEINAKQIKPVGRMPSWIMPGIKFGIVLTDVLLSILCFMIAFAWREGDAFFQANSWHWTKEFAPYGVLLPFVAAIRIITFKTQDLYRLRGEFSFFDDALKVFKAVSIGTLFLVATAFLYRGGEEFKAFSYSRTVFAADFVFALSAFCLFRFTVRFVQIFARKNSINLIPTLVVGNGREAEIVINEMQTKRELGYRVIGVVSDSKFKTQDAVFCDIPIFGMLENLPEIVVNTGASEVIITEQNVSSEVLFDVMMRCGRRKGVEFKLAPGLFDSLPRKTNVEQIGSLPMIQLFRQPLSPVSQFVKRLEDVIIALFATIILSPLTILIAILIKFDSKGNIFYKQKRVGMDGRQFSFYKFRTMQTNNDDSEHREYLKNYIAGETESNGEETVFKLDDSRVTRIGKHLRRLSLDELPQIFNVLRGEMSIVGPRPPIPYEVEEYNATQRRRLDMKPGITGLWQVSGRNRLTFDQMLTLDVFYIENWSLWLDLKIILKTIPAMIRGDGAK